MANPAFEIANSLSASGQLAKQKVFYTVNGEQRVRGYVVPTDPQTQAQIDRRNLFASGMAYWEQQDQAFRDGYNQEVRDKNLKLHGVNLFMSLVLRGLIEVSVIKSVQRGSGLFPAGVTNITITAVDLNKAFLICQLYWIITNNAPLTAYGIYSAKLTTTTNLNIICNKVNWVLNIPVTWQVIEYF